MNAEIPVAILVRVSTDKQSTDRQISELQAAADANGWQVALIVNLHPWVHPLQQLQFTR